MRPFDLETFCSKLADRYRRTATVPTSVWSTKSQEDIRQVYTRLSMKKEERSVPVDYTELFKKTKDGLFPKRILVEGQAGIGKSTFVKKRSLDWAVEPDESSVSEERNVLKKFELVLFIKLREVSHCDTLEDVIRSSDLFAEEDKHLTDDLLRYITENQDKILFVFDGYDEYGKGSDSDVYRVFKADKLRDCCVLMTSRSSQADDVREYADVEAAVTGFSGEDIQKYLEKRLGEAEAKNLVKHLKKRRLIDTAKVPLLTLFFSILWKMGKEKFIARARTRVFREVIQCILDYGHRKCPSSPYKTVEDSEDLLSQLGGVALEALLKDDLLFEYGKLATIKCDTGIIHGFLQITEDAENVRPAERVSFIHKTIQEFLAAWYIVHKYISEDGDLGPLKTYASNLEKCLRFENVFQFVCGLSNDGAVLVLDHFNSIKLADSSLDLSKTIVLPGTSGHTSYDVPYRQEAFHDMVFALFVEAQSKDGLLKRCIQCTSGMVLFSEQLLQNVLEDRNVAREIHSAEAIIFRKLKFDLSFSLGKNLRSFLDGLGVAMRITEESEVLDLGDFYRKFLNCGFLCMCDFSAVLMINEDRISFYITDLTVACEPHESMFTGCPVDPQPHPITCLMVESINNDEERSKSLRLEHLVPLSFPFERDSDTKSVVNEVSIVAVESSLKHLQSVECHSTRSKKLLHDLGVLAAKSKYLNCVDLKVETDVYEFLEQVKEPTVRISIRHFHTCTPTGAERLATLLPRFNNISALSLNLKHCNDVLVRTLVDAITHNTAVKILCLKEIDLTETAAEVLGHSLGQMLALEVLIVNGKNGKNNHLRQPQMQALFERFSTELPLRELELSCFLVEKSGLQFLHESFRFFPRLEVLRLNQLGMDSKDVCRLIAGVNFPELHQLRFSKNPLGHGITSIKEHIVGFPRLMQLGLYGAGCLDEDISCINETVKKVRPMFNVCTMTGLIRLW